MSERSRNANKLTNKPVTPNPEMLDILEDWIAPDVTKIKQKEVSGKTNFLGIPLADLYNEEVKEAEPEVEELPPLTAEEIEQIRQDAYQEGFAQGKEEGSAVGHAEGLEKGHAEGVEQGHEQGYQTGLEQGQTEISEKSQEWQRLCEQLFEPIKQIELNVEQQLLNLALMLAESVIRKETESNKDALLSVLHEAISALPFNTEYAEIHMNPNDILLLSEVYDDEAIAEKQWIIKPEPGYTLGDVVVATPNSLIDRSVKQRIKQVLGSFTKSADLAKELNTEFTQSAVHTVAAESETNDITPNPESDDAIDIESKDTESQG